MPAAHLGLGGVHVLRQPCPRLVVVALGQQPREPVVQLLVGGRRPPLRAPDELVRHAAAGHEDRAAVEPRRRRRDVPSPREALLETRRQADGDRHRRHPLRPVQVTHQRHDGSVVERVVHVVGERARQAGGPAAIDQRGGEVEVAREVVGDAVDELRRLLRREHAAVARRAVHHRRERRDQVARVDDDQVRRQGGEMAALGNEPLPHPLEVRMRELAGEGRLVRAVARRVHREVDADEAAPADRRIDRRARAGRARGHDIWLHAAPPFSLRTGRPPSSPWAVVYVQRGPSGQRPAANGRLTLPHAARSILGPWPDAH